jgi:hypothetical protein
MRYKRYLTALFVAGTLSATPMITRAEDDSDNRNNPTGNEYGEHGRSMMTENAGQDMQSSESLAQLPDGSNQPLPSAVCYSESVIDESTGEVIAFRQVCQEEIPELA